MDACIFVMLGFAMAWIWTVLLVRENRRLRRNYADVIGKYGEAIALLKKATH